MRDPESTGENIGDASSPEAQLDDLRAMRPVRDELKLALAREAAERRLFGAAAPAKIGRFALLGEHAAGGMGVVYTAYDPQLDRRVALKLLNPVALRSPAIRERLLTEARALARLDHPNVVPIHDVVVIEGQFVLVMEWVEGRTLASWEAAAPRSWREYVDAYLGAGRGLAAAHALGLVHRDFKPANAIIGEDRRVRILDFGLARFEGASEDARSEPCSQPETSTLRDARAPAVAAAGLTATGEVQLLRGAVSRGLRGPPVCRRDRRRGTVPAARAAFQEVLAGVTGTAWWDRGSVTGVTGESSTRAPCRVGVSRQRLLGEIVGTRQTPLQVWATCETWVHSATGALTLRGSAARMTMRASRCGRRADSTA